IRRAQRHAEGALFTEAFSPGSSSTPTQTFVKKFRTTFGEEPGAMEALAFDAASLVETALVSGADTRSELRDELKTLVNFPGVTGRISWRDGLFTRNVTIMTIKDGRISEAKDPPPVKEDSSSEN